MRRTGALALMAALGALALPGASVIVNAEPGVRNAASAADAVNRLEAQRSTPSTPPSDLSALERLLFGRGFGRRLRAAPWPSREGWTNARYQRAARKARNVQRNRKAHRG